MTTPNNTPKSSPARRNTVRTGLAGAAVTTAALVGGITLLPGLAGAQEVEPTTPDAPDAEAPAEENEGRRHGKRGISSEVASELLGLSTTEIRDALHSGQTLAQVAEAQGVSTTDLVTALSNEKQANVAEKLAAGDITQEKADEILDGLDERIEERVTTVREARGSRGLAKAASKEALSELLGLSTEEIREGFQAGQTLADQANAQGIDTDDLVDALVTGAQDRVAEGVAAGTITQDRADTILEGIEEKVEAKVTAERPANGESRRGNRGGRRGNHGATAETAETATA